MAQASESAEMWAAAGVWRLVGQGRDEQGGDDEEQQGGVEARFLRVEALDAVAERRRPRRRSRAPARRWPAPSRPGRLARRWSGRPAGRRCRRTAPAGCRGSTAAVPVAPGPTRSPTCSMAWPTSGGQGRQGQAGQDEPEDRRWRRAPVTTPASAVSATAAPSVTRSVVFEQSQVGSERHGRTPTVAAPGGGGADDD